MTPTRDWIRTFAAFALLATLAVAARAADPLWRELAAGSFELDEAALTALLAEAPLEFTEAAGDPRWEITLPTPEGALARFRFVESPIMAPELGAQFPEIRTYRGWGIDDPAATTRFARTGTGFHGIVLSAEGAFSIDPHSGEDPRTYTTSSIEDNDEPGAPCAVVTGAGAEAAAAGGTTLRSARSESRLAPESANTSGTELRWFRLAVAATPSFTFAVSGSLDPTIQEAAAIDAIAQATNFLNLIYEQELAVRFVLVGNNGSIIFTNSLTDPYTSVDVDIFLDENQQALDNVIGEGNYDIGHVFDADSGWEFGGMAQGYACNADDKAKGISNWSTGGPDPAPWSFRMTFAHEIGHQLGALHTFNGVNCGGSEGSRHDDNAYEPDCGRTIMSYGASKFPYFHGTSLRLMTDFIDNCGGCSATSNNNNTPPQVVAPVPTSSNPFYAYYVPVGTPFSLTASGSDPDANLVTYSWENVDNGLPGPSGGDTGDNPLFASVRPTLDPAATFPYLSPPLPPPTPSFLRMATTERLLDFLVTARDGHGGFDQAGVTVAVVGDSGPFAITAPSMGTEVRGGEPMTVTWDVAGTDTGILSTQFVRIRLSTDGGATFSTELAAHTVNDGSFTFTVPCVITDKAHIKIEASGNVYFAYSWRFTILGPTLAAPGSVTVSAGGPPVTGPVATVTDSHDAAEVLAIRAIPGFASGLSLDDFATANNGIVSATAAAQCISAGTRPITLEVTNSAGCTATTTLDVDVTPNPAPTLGDYGDVSVVAGQEVVVSPSTPPADANGNLADITVETNPPLSATLSPDLATGVIVISTTGATQPGMYSMWVRVWDGCGRTVSRIFDLTVTNSPPQITPTGNSVRTTQGGVLGVEVAVATVSDLQDAADTLDDVEATAPAGLTVPVTNSGGTVLASAAATCAVAPDTYEADLTVTDSSQASASTSFPVIVDPNLPPTLGTYFDSAVTVGGSVVNVPNALPSDPNNPAVPVALSVNPQALPGGGQLVAQANGRVTIHAPSGTALATYKVFVTGQDACGAQTTRSFSLRVRSATCVAEQSVVFAADTGNHRIQRYNGVTWTVIGTGVQGSGLGQFSGPEAVVGSPNGQRIYVADTGNSRIQWSQNGGGTWAVFASGLIPQGLVLDRDGNLFVSDARDSLVLRYAAGLPGSPIVLASSGSGAGQVRNPNGLAIDCRMNLHVADTGNNRILTIVTADVTMVRDTGTVLAGPGAGLNPPQVTAPQGVAVDSSGRLYIADTGNNRVLTMASAPAPGPASTLCSLGGGPGQVRAPEGVTITVFTSGPLSGVPSVVVSDTTNNRIQARTLAPGAWVLLGGPPQLNQPSKVR